MGHRGRRRRGGRLKRTSKHFQKRFRQRGGFQISEKQRRRIVDKIRDGKATLLRNEGRRNIYAVKLAESTYRVVYDQQHKILVTCLGKIE